MWLRTTRAGAFADFGGSLGGGKLFVPGDGVISFLGFSERGVDVEINPEYSPVVVDAGGRVPVDLLFEGVSATVRVGFTRWNEPSYRLIADHAAAARPDAGVAGAAERDRIAAGRIGTVTSLEGAGFMVLVRFPYSASLAYGGENGMPAGYRFVNCILDRDGLPRRGSTPARLDLTFRCLPLLSPALRQSNAFPSMKRGEDLFFLYDHDMSDLAGRVPD